MCALIPWQVEGLVKVDVEHMDVQVAIDGFPLCMRMIAQQGYLDVHIRTGQNNGRTLTVIRGQQSFNRMESTGNNFNASNM